MALVRKLEQLTLDKHVGHLEVDCTYSIVQDDEGTKYLQLDTYGSSIRQMPNKKSQSLRFSPEAIEQLKKILQANF